MTMFLLHRGLAVSPDKLLETRSNHHVTLLRMK